MTYHFNSAAYFLGAVAVCSIPGACVAYGFQDTPLGERLEVLAWQLAPLSVAIVLYVLGARAGAWGWLVSVGCLAYVVSIGVKLSSSPTDSIAHFWAPVWSVLFVGPIGLAIGIIVGRLRHKRAADAPRELRPLE